jgi:hypothetical protein
MTSQSTEHFCTLFDSGFLPQGLCLYESLCRHARPFKLWILCMDEIVEAAFRQLQFPEIEILPLREVETEALRAVKPTRSRGEYCWTLSPFIYDMVFDRAPDAERVTYLDADLFFFDRPQILFDEFAASKKDVLITEHAYSPECDQSAASGRFCVQFQTFRRTPGAERVRRWWQERCLEWCYARLEDGKFGDQKYLDCWPEMFGTEVHILRQVERALAPWNASHLAKRGPLVPVFFHFHSLRRLARYQWRLRNGTWYCQETATRPFYRDYCRSLSRALGILDKKKIRYPKPPVFSSLREMARSVREHFKKNEQHAIIWPAWFGPFPKLA